MIQPVWLPKRVIGPFVLFVLLSLGMIWLLLNYTFPPSLAMILSTISAITAGVASYYAGPWLCGGSQRDLDFGFTSTNAIKTVIITGAVFTFCYITTVGL